MTSYDKLCTMYNESTTNSMAELLTNLLKINTPEKNCMVSNPIQPDDNIGEFGNSLNVNIKTTEEGGIEIDSKDMAFKISKDVFEAIKVFITKGDN